MNSYTRLFELIFRRRNHPSNHLGMNTFLPGYRAILAIARDVKNWTKLILKLESLADQLLAARKMFTARDERERLFSIKQGLFRVYLSH
jgi:hypothetical protein